MTLRNFDALPIVTLEALTSGVATLVLAPHPDDESLGCGGLIAEACATGRPPVVVVLSDGTGSHPRSLSYPPERLSLLREREATQASAILGLPPDRLHFLHLRDTALPRSGPEFDDALCAIRKIIRRYSCGVVAAPWRRDPHCDHEAAAAMGRALAASERLRLLSYPVWGWTLPQVAGPAAEGCMGWRLDIVQWLPAKRRAIAAHASQHGRVITDDPGGFRLPPELLEACDRPYEVFLQARDDRRWNAGSHRTRSMRPARRRSLSRAPTNP
ncbi:MAG: PIG-L deacetylase family protein [Acetobacteraceae bacterium]